MIDQQPKIEQEAAGYISLSAPFHWGVPAAVFHYNGSAPHIQIPESGFEEVWVFAWDAPQQVRVCSLLRRSRR